MSLNTKMFKVFQNCNHVTGVCNDSWRLNTTGQYMFPLGVSIRNTSFLGPYWTYNTTYSYIYSTTTWDGAVHQMALNTSDNTTYESTDNTGLWNSGTRVLPNYFGIVKQRNGDLASQDTNGNYFSSTTDTIGRAPGSSTSTTDYSGCGGPVSQITSATISSSPGPSGTTTQVKTCMASISLKTKFHAHNVDMLDTYIQEYTGSAGMLQSVVVYNGTSWASSPAWTFEYNDRDSTDTPDINYGSLTKITLPTGGSISYSYKTYFLCDSDTVVNPANRGVISRTINANDGAGPHTTTYGTTVVNGFLIPVQTDPAGNEILHTFTGLGGSCSNYETKTQYYQGTHTTGTLLRTVQTDYTYQPNHQDVVGDGVSTVINVLPIRITTTLNNNKVSKVEKDYDSNLHLIFHGAFTESYGNVMEMREYDYGSGAPGPLLRKTDYTYKAFDTASYLTANIIDPVSSVTVYDGSGNQVSKTNYGYDEYTLQSSGVTTNFTPPPAGTPRGNLTSVKKWLNTTGGTLNTITTYYDTGMPYRVTDPGGHTTTYSYSLTYAGGYLTQTNLPDTNSPNLAHHVISGLYDFYTAKLTSFTDQNSQATQYAYDSLWRMTSATFPSPDGGQTTFSYPDLVTIERKNKIDGTRWTDMFVHFDGLGREIRRISANDEATPWDQTDTCYDVLGQKHFVTYPYQGNGLSDSQCTKPGDTYSYDTLGRVTAITHSDNSVITTTYTGAATKVTDEGNGTRNLQRVSQVDGLGRLISLCEISSLTLPVGLTPAPAACGQDVSATGFLTSYSYDTLGNLKTVVQGGLNSRTFQYDSLSRLTSGSNPESGTTSYKYDSDSACTTPNSFTGLLISKMDARSIRTCMRYDALNRLTQKNYSDGTPTATYNFDESAANSVTLANTIGRLSSQSTAAPNATGEVYSYDQLGRIKINSQCTPQNCGTSVFAVSYAYDLIGNQTSATNGAGVTFTEAYNRANRLLSLTSSLVDANHPGTLLQNAHYGSFGLTSDSLGNGMSDALGYASRGWLQSVSATSGGTTRYSFSLTFAPDGDIATGNDSVNGNWAHTYDDFNRLLTANATGQAYTYDYDRFGNRWHQNGPHPSSLGFDANNRIVPGSGVTYDAAGNVTADGSHSYGYDAEGHLFQVDGGSAASYVYDANGQRIRKTTGVSSVDYVYDLSGHAQSEMNSSGSWNRGEVFAGGRHVATYGNNTTYFIHSDWLGTERSRTDKSGNSYETCTSLAFGDWLTCTGGDPSPMHFTGKERDAESGLDNFEARYMSSSMGRFMSPDLLGGHQEDPQTLNRYIYARNNPLNFVDPTGLDFNLACSTEENTPTCQNGLQGTTTTTTDANGNQVSKFTATVISNDKNGNLVDKNGNQYNASISGAGVSLSQAGSNQTGSLGVFINGSNPTTVQDAGNFPGFTFNFTYSNIASGVNAGGTFKYSGNYGDAEAALLKAGFQAYPGDAFDPFHLSSYGNAAVDFRSPGAAGTGAGSGHFTVYEPRTILEHGMIIHLTWTTPTRGTLHLGEHNVYNGGLIDHTIEVLKYLFHR